MLNSLRMCWAKIKLIRPWTRTSGHVSPFMPTSQAVQDRIAQASGAYLAPYEKLAAIYGDYCDTVCPDYAAFLPAVARRQGIRLDHVLDLACGTGAVTAGLARVAFRVVGLDQSVAMLGRARPRRAGLGNGRFEQGDYRSPK